MGVSGRAVRERFASRLSLPLIAAPMLRVSGPDLVAACCKAGVIGAFPTSNCRTIEELDRWLTELGQALTARDAPVCPNLIMRSARLAEDTACVIRHGVEIVITSVGSPQPVIAPLHEAGCLVFADVASVRHARKAAADGADGLILLTAGAGGQTGWANGFAFARAVRAFFDGPIVMAGGVCDGPSLLAAEVLGCDFAYMGTRFIATRESLAQQEYKDMLVGAELDDVQLTKAFTGLETNMLRPSIVAAGLDPKALPDRVTTQQADAAHGSGGTGPARWREVWSAGHSVSGVSKVAGAAEVIAELSAEYAAARAGLLARA
jgi:nitronate monooxygenase